MVLGNVKGFVLVACVVVSLFAAVKAVGGPSSQSGREIQLYIVEADDSPSSWVGSTSVVKDGAYAAISDASSRTKVNLAGESIATPLLPAIAGCSSSL